MGLTPFQALEPAPERGDRWIFEEQINRNYMSSALLVNQQDEYKDSTKPRYRL